MMNSTRKSYGTSEVIDGGITVSTNGEGVTTLNVAHNGSHFPSTMVNLTVEQVTELSQLLFRVALATYGERVKAGLPSHVADGLDCPYCDRLPEVKP